MKTSAEVVIIGGGIIGCSTAAELSRLGADVILVERNEIAGAASGRNHGLIFYPQTEIADALYRISHEMYRELNETSEIEIGLDPTPRGFVILVATEDEWEAAEREARASETGGVKIDRLDQAALREAEPNVAHHHLGGWWIDDGYRLDPAALTLAFALEARGNGAEIVTHLDVKQVLRHNGKVRGVATDQGIIEAKVVVDAAGPWAPKIARTVGLDLPMVGARGWLLLTRAVEPLTHHLVESSGWHLTAGDAGPPAITVAEYARGEDRRTPDIGLLVQQNRSGQVLLGGSRLSSTREDPEGHEVTLEIARRAAAAVPKLADIPIVSVWSGVRPMSIDGLPLIGWVPSVEGLFICGGHGGQGVILGGGSGLLAAQVIAQAQTYADPEPFNPARFPLRSFG